MENNTKKGNTVLLTVIAIATLLVAIVGATFAYFTAAVQGNAGASSVIVNTAEIGSITYTFGNELRLDDALPGDNAEVQFTIQASERSTNAIPYAINWVNVTNEFSTNKDDLVYSLSGTATAEGTGEGSNTLVTQAETACPDTAEGPTQIGDAGSLKAGATHTYTLKVTFKETYSDQNSAQGKHFYGKIEVTTGGGSELYYNSENRSGTTVKPSAQAD